VGGQSVSAVHSTGLQVLPTQTALFGQSLSSLHLTHTLFTQKGEVEMQSLSAVQNPGIIGPVVGIVAVGGAILGGVTKGIAGINEGKPDS